MISMCYLKRDGFQQKQQQQQKQPMSLFHCYIKADIE